MVFIPVGSHTIVLSPYPSSVLETIVQGTAVPLPSVMVTVAAEKSALGTLSDHLAKTKGEHTYPSGGHEINSGMLVGKGFPLFPKTHSELALLVEPTPIILEREYSIHLLCPHAVLPLPGSCMYNEIADEECDPSARFEFPAADAPSAV